MSGGGGGGGGAGPGFPEQGEPVDCADLTFATTLSDPIPEVVDDLKEGDVLAVELRTEPRRISVVDGDGRDAGAIATQQWDRLLECLQSGNEYEAEVLSVDGGAVRVRVGPA